MLKTLRRLGGLVLTLCACYLAGALVLGFVPTTWGFAETPEGIPVAVCSNGVHTDFVLPVKTEEVDWSALFPPRHFAADVSRFDHVGIGWGDLDFYRTTPRWRDFRFGTALRALAGLGPAALHVQYRSAPGPNERCGGLRASVVQYRSLATYIFNTIASTAGPTAPGYGTSDVFYKAQGRFSLLETCNAWVGRGLRKSGLPSGVWTPFAFQVLSHL